MRFFGKTAAAVLTLLITALPVSAEELSTFKDEVLVPARAYETIKSLEGDWSGTDKIVPVGKSIHVRPAAGREVADAAACEG